MLNLHLPNLLKRRLICLALTPKICPARDCLRPRFLTLFKTSNLVKSFEINDMHSSIPSPPHREPITYDYQKSAI